MCKLDQVSNVSVSVASVLWLIYSERTTLVSWIREGIAVQWKSAAQGGYWQVLRVRELRAANQSKMKCSWDKIQLGSATQDKCTMRPEIPSHCIRFKLCWQNLLLSAIFVASSCATKSKLDVWRWFRWIRTIPKGTQSLQERPLRRPGRRKQHHLPSLLFVSGQQA